MAAEKREKIMEVLPGGCAAPVHNTYRAAMRPKGHPLHCSCSKAQEMRKRELVRRCEVRLERRMQKERGGAAMASTKVYVLPGGGPWRILAHCPALLHNTQRAALSGPIVHRCVCPRGLEMKERYNAQKNASRARQRKEENREKGNTASIYLRDVRRPANAPSIRGACHSTKGMKLADQVMRGSAAAREEHQIMCAACPALVACRKWVLEEELIPGNWGGVYGGLTVTDRKRIARERKKHQEQGAAA